MVQVQYRPLPQTLFSKAFAANHARVILLARSGTTFSLRPSEVLLWAGIGELTQQHFGRPPGRSADDLRTVSAGAFANVFAQDAPIFLLEALKDFAHQPVRQARVSERLKTARPADKHPRAREGPAILYPVWRRTAIEAARCPEKSFVAGNKPDGLLQRRHRAPAAASMP